MSNFTTTELAEYLVENADTLFGYNSPWDGINEMEWYDEKKSDGVEIPGFGMLEFVDNFGGEGQGDDQWVVFKVGDRLFRMSGYYNSWSGGEWDGSLEEVEAKEVTVTQYFTKADK